jgi:hypothetical protein
VVMIDDFQVPFDTGFKYDDYGPGQALTASYIAPSVARYDLAVFYPSTPAAEEDGAGRGCVVLASDAAHITALDAIRLLRPGESSQRGLRRTAEKSSCCENKRDTCENR